MLLFDNGFWNNIKPIRLFLKKELFCHIFKCTTILSNINSTLKLLICIGRKLPLVGTYCRSRFSKVWFTQFCENWTQDEQTISLLEGKLIYSVVWKCNMYILWSNVCLIMIYRRFFYLIFTFVNILFITRSSKSPIKLPPFFNFSKTHPPTLAAKMPLKKNVYFYPWVLK